MAYDSNLTVSAVSLAMSIQDVRAKVAAANIATANVPASEFLSFDYQQPLAALRDAATSPELLSNSIAAMREDGLSNLVQSQARLTSADSLDEQVAELSSASGRYQALADGMSRQFAMMQIAIRGGR